MTSADLEFCKVPISNLCLTCNQRTNLSGVVVVCLIALLNGCAGTPDQLEIMACPVCRKPLVLRGEEALKCNECKRVYPIRNGIPILQEPEATIEEF